MSLYLGCELHSNMDLQDILEKRKYVTMAGSSYVLLEFSEGDSAQHIRERVYNVLSCGYEPIIAHVERYQATVKSVGFSSDLVDMGARLQVNVESILGKYTWGAKRYCRKLMKEDLLGFVGSDSHNTKTRIPNIGAGAAYVSKKMGEAYAERIFHDNPMENLKGCRRNLKKVRRRRWKRINRIRMKLKSIYWNCFVCSGAKLAM